MKKEDTLGRSPPRINTLQGPGNAVPVASWQEWDSIARRDHATRMQRLVDGIFRQEVMGGLALLLIPLLLLLDFVPLAPGVFAFLSIIDVAIWVFFILEYVCRLIVAENRVAYIVSPWNILDLIIIAVPAIALVMGAGYGISRYLRVLRVMQAFQVLYVGAKGEKNKIDRKSAGDVATPPGPGLRIRTIALPNTPGTDAVPAWDTLSPESITRDINTHHTWVDFSGYSKSDYPVLSEITHIPLYILGERLKERAYPRSYNAGKFMTVFLKIPRVNREQGDAEIWDITWDGLLVAFSADQVMTFSKSGHEIVDKALVDGIDQDIVLDGPGVLYLCVNRSLDIIEDLILSAEEQLVCLETRQVSRLPPNFLSMMYTSQKELSRVTSGLLHTKNALEEVCHSGGEISCLDEVRVGRLHSLTDRVSLLYDNADHVSDSFSWMADYYLNLTSFSMNRVMKILTVLAAMTLIPTLIGGFLGTNLVGNPWPVTLLQMITLVGLLMFFTAWIYYNLGWLRD
jgi:Mg2+ and Co2+ transporter CorA